MADRTLTFASSFTVTVDGESVTSPYTLTKSCVIHASHPDGDTYALRMNGEDWGSLPYPLVVEDENISLTWIGGMVNPGGPSGLTINYEAASVPTPDWANCFVKTSAGNKAVEKVWIKQNGQLVTVYDGGGGGAAVNFATDSWETISAACKDGSYKTVYKVGDTKEITLSTGETITVAIMGFDHDDLSDGSGKAPITVAMENLLATKYRMNATDTNAGGWDESEMRTSTMATLLTQLSSDLQSVIKQVNKKATVGSLSTSIATSSDKLWLLAEVEVDGTTEAGYVDEGEQYEYWKTVKDGTVRADRIKYLSNGSGSANGWWLRSPSIPFTTNFSPISTQGGLDSNDANYNYGVCFGFCVG